MFPSVSPRLDFSFVTIFVFTYLWLCGAVVYCPSVLLPEVSLWLTGTDYIALEVTTHLIVFIYGCFASVKKFWNVYVMCLSICYCICLQIFFKIPAVTKSSLFVLIWVWQCEDLALVEVISRCADIIASPPAKGFTLVSACSAHLASACCNNKGTVVLSFAKGINEWFLLWTKCLFMADKAWHLYCIFGVSVSNHNGWRARKIHSSRFLKTRKLKSINLCTMGI